MLVRSAVLLLSILGVAVSNHAWSQSTYTEQELKDARLFMDTKLTGDKHWLLEMRAAKAGLRPEELFLDVARLSGNNYLGYKGPKPNFPIVDGVKPSKINVADRLRRAGLKTRKSYMKGLGLRPR